MRNRRLKHETLGFQRHAVEAGAGWEFQPGDRVLADGLPGVVASVDDTNPYGIESYTVTLDNGLGGGEYTAAQLQKPGSTTAALTSSQDVSDELSPVEGSFVTTADHWYPELGTILHDRPPNERIQRVAGLQRTAASDPDDEYYNLQEAINRVSSDKAAEENAAWHDRRDENESDTIHELRHELLGLGENADLNVGNGAHHEHGMTASEFLHATIADHPYYPDVVEKLKGIKAEGSLHKQAFGPSQYVFEPGTKVMAAGLPGYIVQVLPQPVNQPFGEHSYVVGFNQGLGQQIFTQAQLVRTAAKSPDYNFGYEHGLVGAPGNKPYFQRRIDAGKELDPEDHDYLRGHADGTAELARRDQHRAETGEHRCNECWGTGMDAWRTSHCSACGGHGSISAEEANKVDVLHHLTDDPHFSPRADFVPEDNAIAIHGRSRPGLFAAYPHDVESWVHGHGYDRPYVAEIHVPRYAHEPGRWGGERFIPGEHLDKAVVTRVVPRDQHTAAYDPRTEESVQEPPTACSYCGNPGPWTDEQDTGRGTRIRCGTCGGTMRLNADEEAGTTGIQWQPEFPNSPQNAASRAGDPRATINDFRIVSGLREDFANAVMNRIAGKCPACSGTGEQGTGHECYACDGTGLLSEYDPSVDNANPENGLLVGRDDSRGIEPVLGSQLNAPATEEAGYAIFTAPELLAHLNQQLQATAASLDGYSDEDFVFHFTASWSDVRKKATRIRKEGGVRILVANNTHVVGEVQGDTALYESALNYVPGTKKVADWACGCKWGAYAWGRSPAYKRFEGRQCSHVLALQYEAQARGMFGREVSPDRDRLEGQYQRSPVQVQYERPSERYPEGRDLRRRTVPPGNMRRTFSSLEKDAYLVEDVPPSHEWARLFTALGTPPSEVVHAMHALGVPHAAARAAIDWATKSTASAAVATEDGQTHVAVAVENGLVHTAAGRQLPVDAVHLVLAKEQQSATADPGQGEPGTDIPRIDKRDQSAKKKDPRHLRHHTNDAREHAPIWGYGVPWGGAYMWCGQCLGSGCGHCGGSGQVAAPTTGTAAPSDASTTSSPVADQSVDAGGMIGGGGISATGAVHDRGYDRTTHMRCDFCNQIHDHDDFRETEDGRYKCSGCALYGDGHGHLYDDSARGWEGTTGSLHEAADRGFSEHNHFLERLDRGPEEEPDLAGHRDEYAKDVTTHTGHNYTLLTGTHTFGGDTMVSAHRRLSNGKYQGVGYLSWFGGKPRHDGSNIDGGVVYKAHVAEQHRRRGVASAMLDFARERHPEMDIRHSTALTEDGKAWAQAYASLQHTADYTSGDFGNYNSQTPAQQITPHANTPNPASTGWAASADPSGWERPVVDSSFMHWESMLHHGFVMTAAGDTSKPPTHAGVALKAADTGRVLMIQRSNKDEKDPARGTWEFPGGGREDGDLTSLHTGIREWEEEVGQAFPEGGHVTHVHRSGPYVLHTVVIPEESGVDFTNGRATVNPDDPDGDDHEQSAWWDPAHAKKNPALRPECKSSPWGDISKAAAREDWFTDKQREYWDVGHQHGTQGLHGLYGRAKEDEVLYGMRPSHLMAPYMDGHEEALRSQRSDEPEAISHRFMQPSRVGGHCATCGSPSNELGEHTGQCPRCDALQNVGAPPNRPEPYGGEHRRNSGPQIFNGEHEDFDLRGYHPEEHLMHSLSSRHLTVDEARAIGQAEVARTGKSAEQLLREGPSLQHDLDLIFQGTLHDEPEPALPSTDGSTDVDDDASESASDLDSDLDNASQLAVPGLPVDRAAPWGYPESAADHPDPTVAQPGSADLDMESAPEDQDQSALESVISNFQRSAGFQALMSDAAPQGGSGDGPTDADIAAAARAALTKTSMKDFSFAEQQELIAEGGGKARARNFSDLRIAGTHYEMLGDGEPDDEALHLFL